MTQMTIDEMMIAQLAQIDLITTDATAPNAKAQVRRHPAPAFAGAAAAVLAAVLIAAAAIA